MVVYVVKKTNVLMSPDVMVIPQVVPDLFIKIMLVQMGPDIVRLENVEVRDRALLYNHY